MRRRRGIFFGLTKAVEAEVVEESVADKDLKVIETGLNQFLNSNN